MPILTRLERAEGGGRVVEKIDLVGNLLKCLKIFVRDCKTKLTKNQTGLKNCNLNETREESESEKNK